MDAENQDNLLYPGIQVTSKPFLPLSSLPDVTAVLKGEAELLELLPVGSLGIGTRHFS